jgi:glycerol-3-phosphate dehydrogenase (NAD(P)+)
MAVVTILGAGAMGAALTTPALAAGNEVRLWGTWLDDDILAALRVGRPHPRIDVPIDQAAVLFDSDDLAAGLDGAELVVLAISSDGVVEVLRRAAPHLRPGLPLLITTKGFGYDPDGKVGLLPPLLRAVLPRELADSCPIVAIGGPCKANEVAVGRPTAAVFGCADVGVAGRAADLLGTEVYRLATTDDVDGIEASAAMKNVYAIALGACDGLQEGDGMPRHDLKSAVFTQAVAEMRTVALALGGRAETVTGYAGVGDLQVTGLSGRNRVFGERLGKGERADDALAAMRAAGQTVEGHPAAFLAVGLVDELADDGDLDPEEMPLLGAIENMLRGATEVEEILAEAALPELSEETTGRPASLPG